MDFAIKPAAVAPVTQDNRPIGTITAQLINDLRAAAERYATRRDAFANGKELTCRDMAAKLERYGEFASAKQAEYAAKLIEWSKPRTAAPAAKAPVLAVPDLFAVMQKHAHFYADDLKLSRKNGDSLVWIIWHNIVVGKIDGGVVNLFRARLREQLDSDGSRLEALLREFEANPLAAAMKYGKLSGRCCSCGRDLTDPASIEAGIGPVCAEKFAL